MSGLINGRRPASASGRIYGHRLQWQQSDGSGGVTEQKREGSLPSRLGDGDGYPQRLREIVERSGGQERQRQGYEGGHEASTSGADVRSCTVEKIESNKRRVELLWRTLRLDSSGQDALSSIYLHQGTLTDAAAIELALTRLQHHRFLTISVLKCITCRESVLSKLQEQLAMISHKFSPPGREEGDGNQGFRPEGHLSSALDILLDEYASNTRTVVEAIQLWRGSLGIDQPFIWRGYNYLDKICDDVDKLRTSPAFQARKFPVLTTGLMLPPHRVKMDGRESSGYVLKLCLGERQGAEQGGQSLEARINIPFKNIEGILDAERFLEDQIMIKDAPINTTSEKNTSTLSYARNKDSNTSHNDNTASTLSNTKNEGRAGVYAFDQDMSVLSANTTDTGSLSATMHTSEMMLHESTTTRPVASHEITTARKTKQQQQQQQQANSSDNNSHSNNTSTHSDATLSLVGSSGGSPLVGLRQDAEQVIAAYRRSVRVIAQQRTTTLHTQQQHAYPRDVTDTSQPFRPRSASPTQRLHTGEPPHALTKEFALTSTDNTTTLMAYPESAASLSLYRASLQTVSDALETSPHNAAAYSHTSQHPSGALSPPMSLSSSHSHAYTYPGSYTGDHSRSRSPTSSSMHAATRRKKPLPVAVTLPSRSTTLSLLRTIFAQFSSPPQQSILPHKTSPPQCESSASASFLDRTIDLQGLCNVLSALAVYPVRLLHSEVKVAYLRVPRKSDRPLERVFQRWDSRSAPIIKPPVEKVEPPPLAFPEFISFMEVIASKLRSNVDALISVFREPVGDVRIARATGRREGGRSASPYGGSEGTSLYAGSSSHNVMMMNGVEDTEGVVVLGEVGAHRVFVDRGRDGGEGGSANLVRPMSPSGQKSPLGALREDGASAYLRPVSPNIQQQYQQQQQRSPLGAVTVPHNNGVGRRSPLLQKDPVRNVHQRSPFAHPDSVPNSRSTQRPWSPSGYKGSPNASGRGTPGFLEDEGGGFREWRSSWEGGGFVLDDTLMARMQADFNKS